MVFFKAISILLGTIIGVGIFGLPFVAMKAGFLVMVTYLFIISGVIFLIHFLYGEIVLATEEKYRLPGYVEKYLGFKWKNFSFMVIAIGLWGALLAYLIIGGEFLSSFFFFLFRQF
jgi:tyrosine-specific transport protein